ncbi:uncharacterized protein [Rutidosis leptorrhynchoides]|uniref:uncharacterized protein n=1 Tax=Rutidosis leptorrhynchoides TaxID=125765 RepID=UPI003A98E6C6
MDDIMQTIPIEEKVIIGGNLNGHVGTSRDANDEAHGGYGYGSRNREGESILDFASTYDLDCKAIPGEALTTQHRLLGLDMRIRQWKPKKNAVKKPKIRWWSLKRPKQEDFKNSMAAKVIWSLDDANTMWEAMESYIKRVASSTLGVSKGKGVTPRGAWWWDDAVKEKIKEKRILFRNLPKSQDAFAFEKYKLASKEAKKAVKEAKNKFFDGLYDKLDT